MTRKKTQGGSTTTAGGPTSFDQARDELFSHILRCGVIEAEGEHQKAWFDDTMQYLAERYLDLSDEELAKVRLLGERYCQPVVRHTEAVGSAST